MVGIAKFSSKFRNTFCPKHILGLEFSKSVVILEFGKIEESSTSKLTNAQMIWWEDESLRCLEATELKMWTLVYWSGHCMRLTI